MQNPSMYKINNIKKSDPTDEKKCSAAEVEFLINPPVIMDKSESVFSSADFTLKHPSTNPPTAIKVKTNAHAISLNHFFMSLATLVLF